MKASNIYTAEIGKHTEVSPGTFETTIHVNGNFRYEVGQYVWVVLPKLIKADSKGERRAFSISSAPAAPGMITITYRASQSGYKQTLVSLKNGDAIEIIGPFGSTLSLQEYDSKNFVAIVGGTGIAPFKAVSEWLLENPSVDKKLTVIHTGESEATMPHYSSMKKLSDTTRAVSYKPYFKKFEWSMLPLLTMRKKPHVFIIGPQGFVNYVSQAFYDKGYEKSLLHFETYYPEVEIQELRDLMSRFDSFLNDKDLSILHFTDQNEKLLAVLAQGIKNSSNHTVITDRNAYIMYANKAAQKTTGFSLGEMQDQTPRLWGGQMSKEFYRKLWKAKTEGNIVTDEITNRKKNGELYSCIAHITPIINNKKIVIGFFAVEQDIEALKKSQRIIAIKEQRLSLALAGGKKGVWDRDFIHERIFLSKEWKAMLGYEEHEIKDEIQEWEKRIHPEDRKIVEDALQEHILGRAPFYECEFRMLCKNGKYKWVLDQGKVATKLGEKNPHRMVGTMTDIHEIKEQAETLRKQYEQLERMNKLMVGRELRMIELKKEIKKLKDKA